jgi:AcrR family transcriptional regulator
MPTKVDLRTTDTKDRVLKEARRLYRLGGYRHMGLEQIAQSLNVTRPALYHHFPYGKEQLLMEMVQDFTREKAEQWQAAIKASPNARDRFQGMLYSVIDEPLLNHRELVCTTLNKLDSETKETIHQNFKVLHDLAMQVFEEGIARGELRKIDLDVAFFSFIGLCEQIEGIINIQGKFPEAPICGPYTSYSLAEKLLQLWLDGLALPQNT